MREKIKDYAIHYQGNYQKILTAIKNHESVPDYKCESEYLTIGEENYPTCFYQLDYPPLCLFYEGDISLLKKRCLSVIGSRHATNYGLKMTEKIVNLLKQEYIMVSGMAIGIDGCVHQHAKQTIAVIGCGLSINYPKQNQAIRNKVDLVISEYPWSVLPHQQHFPWRNRLIAALGEKVLLMQATLKSGSMHTINYALKLGRDIYCLPHRLDDEQGQGCLSLIKDGAYILDETACYELMKGR